MNLLQLKDLSPTIELGVHAGDEVEDISELIILSAPEFYGHWGERYVVDKFFLDKQVLQFDAYTEGGYTPPVLRQHQMNGEREGDIIKLYHDGTSLFATVRWCEPEKAKENIKSGRWKYVSGGFWSFTDDKGREYDFGLIEVSLASIPHITKTVDGGARILNSIIPDSQKALAEKISPYLTDEEFRQLFSSNEELLQSNRLLPMREATPPTEEDNLILSSKLKEMAETRFGGGTAGVLRAINWAKSQGLKVVK